MTVAAAAADKSAQQDVLAGAACEHNSANAYEHSSSPHSQASPEGSAQLAAASEYGQAGHTADAADASAVVSEAASMQLAQSPSAADGPESGAADALEEVARGDSRLTGSAQSAAALAPRDAEEPSGSAAATTQPSRAAENYGSSCEASSPSESSSASHNSGATAVAGSGRHAAAVEASPGSSNQGTAACSGVRFTRAQQGVAAALLVILKKAMQDGQEEMNAVKDSLMRGDTRFHPFLALHAKHGPLPSLRDLEQTANPELREALTGLAERCVSDGLRPLVAFGQILAEGEYDVRFAKAQISQPLNPVMSLIRDIWNCPIVPALIIGRVLAE